METTEAKTSPGLEELQTQHQQLRKQLQVAIVKWASTYSLGEGWSTVLVPKPSLTPMRLDRSFGRPALRALYINHPHKDSDESFNIVVDILADSEGTGAYSLDADRDMPVFSTSALLTLLSAMEEEELSVEKDSCAQY